MRTSILAISFAVLVICRPGVAAAEEPNAAEKIGRQIDQAAGRLASELKQAWGDVQRSVDKLGLRGRVYARLHFDRDLNRSNLEVQAVSSDVVSLKGKVPSTSAKEKAVRLAAETVGVREVVDHLSVSPPEQDSK